MEINILSGLEWAFLLSALIASLLPAALLGWLVQVLLEWKQRNN